MNDTFYIPRGIKEISRWGLNFGISIDFSFSDFRFRSICKIHFSTVVPMGCDYVKNVELSSQWKSQ